MNPAKIVMLAGMLVPACGMQPENQAPSGIENDRHALQTDRTRSHVRFRVVDEDADSRCDRRMTAITSMLSKAEQRSVVLSASALVSKDGIRQANVGRERLLCFAPSGQVEYFHLDRMAERYHKTGPKPSSLQLSAAAKKLISALDAQGLVVGRELDFSGTKWAEIQTGTDSVVSTLDSTVQTIGYRTTVPRKLGGIPVRGNGVSIQLDSDLSVVSLKVAWRDVEREETDVAAVKATEADASFRAQTNVATATGVVAEVSYVDGGFMSEQRYLEPWYLYQYHDGKKKLWGTPAISAKERITLVKEVEPSVQRRTR